MTKYQIDHVYPIDCGKFFIHYPASGQGYQFCLCSTCNQGFQSWTEKPLNVFAAELKFAHWLLFLAKCLGPPCCPCKKWPHLFHTFVSKTSSSGFHKKAQSSSSGIHTGQISFRGLRSLLWEWRIFDKYLDSTGDVTLISDNLWLTRRC